MKEIILRGGAVAIVDDAEFERLSQYRWREQSTRKSDRVYAVRSGVKGVLLMHHYVLPKRPGFDVDHINGNPLDNRAGNLRYATRSQNLFNSKIQKNNKTGFKGVSKTKSGLYQADIWANGVHLYLGTFKEMEQAVAARKAAERVHHGEFARQ